MLCKPLEENLHSPICCNFDPVSNVSDVSDLQEEKHDLHKISTLAGIIILCKALDGNSILQFVAISIQFEK
jgi:hypothetical protein